MSLSQGLKRLIDWANINVELVGEARDGQQLKEVIEETDPDIVIADIMMPNMTGLEVIRWYNEVHSHAKIIFISGYQEFTYAKEALQNGAVDYLLKPVGRKDLDQVHTEMSVGIGMQSTGAKQLKNAYKTAKFAFELYYFEEKPLIDFKDIHKDYTVSFEDYSRSFN